MYRDQPGPWGETEMQPPRIRQSLESRVIAALYLECVRERGTLTEYCSRYYLLRWKERNTHVTCIFFYIKYLSLFDIIFFYL